MKNLLIAIAIVLAIVLGPMIVREYFKQHPRSAPYCDPDPTECG